MTIAITGGIGSGKTYVRHLLEQRGHSVFDCDSTARQIIATDPDVRRQLSGLVGAPLTKDALRRYIHAAPGHAARVNAVVHPRVAEAFGRSGQSWMECAILFESGFDRLVDRVIVVTCPLDIRLRRIMARDRCDEDTARRWVALQMSDADRLSRADYHIVNDGTTPLEPQLDAILTTL